jgi:hypothetical protein
MLSGESVGSLAEAIYEHASNNSGVRHTLSINVLHHQATPVLESAAEVPMLSSLGNAQDLAQLLNTFLWWNRPIQVGVHYLSGIFEFWVEPDPK